MNIDYNLLKIFIKVTELGSFTKAAKFLNRPKSTVSRAISKLENELGVELVRRTTRKISLTSTGKEFYGNIAPHLKEIGAELIRISDVQEEMQGTIRITTSDSFAQHSLASMISEFTSKYPKVFFETVITNDFVDLIEENIDIAIRAGKLKDSTLIQKKFVPSKFILVCSEKYIQKYSQPKSLDELKNHKYLSFKPVEKLFKKIGVSLNPIMVTGSVPMLLKMSLNGDGVTVLPDIICQKYIDSKELIRIVPSWQSKSENIHILYPPTKNQPKRVKEFIRFAKDFHLK